MNDEPELDLIVDLPHSKGPQSSSGKSRSQPMDLAALLGTPHATLEAAQAAAKAALSSGDFGGRLVMAEDVQPARPPGGFQFVDATTGERIRIEPPKTTPNTFDPDAIARQRIIDDRRARKRRAEKLAKAKRKQGRR